mgnify:CR=1 FL=1
MGIIHDQIGSQFPWPIFFPSQHLLSVKASLCLLNVRPLTCIYFLLAQLQGNCRNELAIQHLQAALSALTSSRVVTYTASSEICNRSFTVPKVTCFIFHSFAHYFVLGFVSISTQLKLMYDRFCRFPA